MRRAAPFLAAIVVLACRAVGKIRREVDAGRSGVVRQRHVISLQHQAYGAKLYLLLPVPPSSHQSGSFPRALPLVLVVDDADDNRLLYASTIAEAGYDVEEATNGVEALERIGVRRPAVIVMDLSMPLLDGWEATRRIKSDPRTADVIVIAITAHSTRYGLQQASDAGADAVLTKPCLPVDLLGVIGALLPDERATG